jgi:hypothetical protein
MHSDSWRGQYHGPRFGALRIAGLVMGGVVFAAVFAFLFGWLVELLWNRLMPDLFGIKEITYWQAFGIVILAKILFGGPGKGFHHPGHHHRHWMKLRRHCRDWDGSEVWKPHGAYANWKYYDRYWREEGKAAFEAYIDRIEKEKDLPKEQT